MKYLFLVIALAAAVVLAALYVPVRDGKPLLDRDWVSNMAGESAPVNGKASPVADEMPTSPVQQSPSYYRWRDDRGRWQYGDRPPPGVAAEPVEVEPGKQLSSEAVRQGRLDENENTQQR